MATTKKTPVSDAKKAIITAAERRGVAVIDTGWLSAVVLIGIALLIGLGFLAQAVYGLTSTTVRIGRCNMEQLLEHRVANQAYHDIFVPAAKKLDPGVTVPPLKEINPPTEDQIITAHRRLLKNCKDLLPSSVLTEVLTPTTSTVPR